MDNQFSSFYKSSASNLHISWLVLPSLLVVYVLANIVYRLYFHPLARFPGPKLAAITHLYEFYFNIIQDGMFIWEIERMHEVYGPIVRITPYELHVKDPQFYDDIYAASTRKTEKYLNFVSHFGTPLSMITTIGHDHHRIRRAPLNSFFSKRSVVRLEPVIQENIDKLCKRFDDDCAAQNVVRLDVAFIALTTDIITRYSYGKSYNYLNEPDYKLEWKDAVLEASANGAAMRHFPFMLALSKNMPRSLLRKLNSRIAILLEIQDMVRSQSLESLNNSNKGTNTGENGQKKSIFDALNDPELLAPEERTIDRLQDEGQILLGAGSETTAKSLTVIALHLLRDPSVLERLRGELKTVMPTTTSTASWTELEKLPFLTAVIKEGLRLSYGVTTRLPRVSPTEALQYKDWIIPPGTPVSESSYFVHMDPSIFPSPESFDPSRWLIAAANAYAELYLTVAHIFRRYDFHLYDTNVDDVKLVRDRFFGAPKDGSKGVRVYVEGLVKE
ncbi:hypothetical protein UA08_04932 [Talaromyces atroroseus]|uniref:Trichodiene oxygenase n=1 Tax=Talaromyces atroroseus TaxID=1441469 RepID=A0A225B0E7_TALAT|nr:hypothetical protein UA08_04932 [Talaromyces atroroseus]OKL60205.1 hypothetical protein UA08_04932 [Talaromyces atroroseus]